MNQEEILECIKDVFTFACIDFLESLGCNSPQLVGLNANHDEDLVSLIDAGGDCVDLSMALSLPNSILSMTYPVGSSSADAIVGIDDDALEDWASEISNRLIGSIKTTLASHNFDVLIGIPSTSFGIPAEDVITNHGNPIKLTFDVDGLYLTILFDVELFEESSKFNPNPVEVEAIDEGELEFF